MRPLFAVLLSLGLFYACQAQDAAQSHQQGSQNRDDASRPGKEDLVCFVIRTYWAHGQQYGDQSLKYLLQGLKTQTHQKWEAVIMVLDQRPFPDLAKVVGELNDDRIWVFAEWIKYAYKPKETNGMWSDGYHKRLYNLTDEAVRACPKGTKWVVVTNGDNAYDNHFAETVVAAPDGYDVVAFDFYSRYQRPTAVPCERFADTPADASGVPPPRCKENEQRFCQTDLAASAWRFSRFLGEDRRFATVDKAGDSQAADGIMAAEVTAAGWRVWRVSGRCLVSHAPNPQMCAAVSGVWDDSGMWSPDSFGGGCISRERAQQKLASGPSTYEVVALNITFDPASFTFAHLGVLPLTCLRATDRASWGTAASVFGRICAARLDLPAYPHELGPHPWDVWLPADLRTQLDAEHAAAVARHTSAAAAA